MAVNGERDAFWQHAIVFTASTSRDLYFTNTHLMHNHNQKKTKQQLGVSLLLHKFMACIYLWMCFCLDCKMLEMAVKYWLSTSRFMNVSGETASPAMACLIANCAGGVGVIRKQVCHFGLGTGPERDSAPNKTEGAHMKYVIMRRSYDWCCTDSTSTPCIFIVMLFSSSNLSIQRLPNWSSRCDGHPSDSKMKL